MESKKDKKESKIFKYKKLGIALIIVNAITIIEFLIKEYNLLTYKGDSGLDPTIIVLPFLVCAEFILAFINVAICFVAFGLVMSFIDSVFKKYDEKTKDLLALIIYLIIILTVILVYKYIL